ncbi:MAG: ATP synthase subunit beta, partial [Candidatus Gottesmanbacteria bacterium GW2011_GWC2_39_8]
MNKGKITQIRGAVIDIEFPRENIPAIYNALSVGSEFVSGGKLILEIEAHLGEGKVRAVALGPTD